jgi:hypothetical protein
MATYHEQILSSRRFPNARRPKTVLLELQQRSLEKLQKYLDALVEEDALTNDNSKADYWWLMNIRRKLLPKAP